MEKKNNNWNNILLIIILAIGFVIAAIVLIFSHSGEYVLIEKDGEIVGQYDLSQDGSYVIEGDGINEKNTVTIENHQVFMSDASCPDHLCMNMGKKSRTNESIVCLPNKLVVTIKGKEEQSEFDAISQ